MGNLTQEELDYYEAPDDLAMTWEEDRSIDEDTSWRIVIMAEADVRDRRKKRPESDFKSHAEYKLYLLCLYDASLRADRR
ncbi:MAG: hypothetical protein E7271_09570 [Lachnospiraceae bacterium]|jgi:hypothetical protein|nr:hypothetical protein [Lachnospiraceae bacterium]